MIKRQKPEWKGPITNHTLRIEKFKLGGKYLIFDLIAFGKNSAVYYGIEEETKLERIFKFYNLKEIQHVKGFKEKEICKRKTNYLHRIMKSCKSINIIKCLDIYEDRNYKVLVYQYCQNSLQKEIENRVQIKINQIRAILILKQILSALKDLNLNANLLHTNLKPDKILIKNGVYKLIDFGLLFSAQTQNQNNLLAPQILSKQKYTQKAQVWSIGILFHQILYGKIPQILLNQNRKYLQMQNDSIFVIKEENWKTSKKVSNFLKQSLQLNPQLRMSLQDIETHPIFQILEQGIESKVQQSKQEWSSIIRQNIIRQSSRQGLSVILPLCQNSQNFITTQQTRKLSKFCQQTFQFESGQKQLQHQLQKKYQRLGKSFQIQQLQRTSIQHLKSQVNRKQAKMYDLMKKYYLDCLKVQFIYYEIIKPLQVSKASRTQRHQIQLLYMILSTCFSTMSRLNQMNKDQKQSSDYQNLLQSCVRKSTQILYKLIQTSQKECGELLTKIESNFKSIIFDRFSKAFNEQMQKKRDIYLGGIQNIDFQQQQKIEFTLAFFQKHRKDMEKLRKKQRNMDQIRKAFAYLQVYTLIWKIANERQIQEKYPSLKNYIDKQILYLEFNFTQSKIHSEIL